MTYNKALIPEFYDDVIVLLQSLLQTYVSEPMWAVYVELYKVFKSTDRQSILPFSEIAHVLHMYIVVDNESFLAFPDRMNAMIDMCQLTLQVMPTIIVTALRRLMKPSDEEGLRELRPLLFLVSLFSGACFIPSTSPVFFFFATKARCFAINRFFRDLD
ncbi:hypothetical protein OESDEN_01481 [Oesophagostomum dentatum]|uniref:Uncharacterized protein n=1 Tax=Oesophagostomum dentatum TaxID=61180 RepID=A0A0B1TQZ2_OESDE|nr:hypothetical protein OESDEN_01481 [Oesophagostomum dentatum]